MGGLVRLGSFERGGAAPNGRHAGLGGFSQLAGRADVHDRAHVPRYRHDDVALLVAHAVHVVRFYADAQKLAGFFHLLLVAAVHRQDHAKDCRGERD